MSQDTSSDTTPTKPSESSTSESGPAKKGNNKAVGLVALLGMALILGFFVVLGVGIYKFDWEQRPGTATVTSVIPFPAARVDYSFISIREYGTNLSAIKKYYEATTASLPEEATDSPLPSDEELKQSVIERLVDMVVIQKLNSTYSLAVDQAQIDEEYGRVVEQTGGDEEVAQTLQDLYGWNADQFKKFVLVPFLERSALEKYVISNPEINAEARAKAERVLAEARSEGADFTEIATNESEGPSAGDGGELGEFGRGEMVPEFEEAAFALQPGEISDIVETQFGYHIIKVDARNDEAGTVTARHILIQPRSFDLWLAEQKDEMTIKIYI
jgi:hypothetical protein